MARQIFVSYSKKDANFAFKLVEGIEAEDHRVWIDREIGGGQQWRQTIEQSVKDSSEMIVIISKNSVASRWVQHESSMAYALDKKLVPVVIDEESLANLNFAWIDEIQYIDFTKYSYDHALALLLKSLAPPNPLQDMLDQQLVAYRQTGDLMGEALLSLVEEGRNTLIISEDAESLIADSERTVQFRRQLYRGGIGVVVVLAILALFFFGASIQSGRQAANSQATNLAVQTQIAQAKTEQAVAELEAKVAAGEAVEQIATSVAEINAAETEISVAQTQMANLSEQQEISEQKAAEAEQKFLEAELALQEIFDDTGLVFVENGPGDLYWDGNVLWVVNREGNSIQAIETGSGQLGAKLNVGVQPMSIVSDATYVWVADQFDDTVTQINPLTREITKIPTGDGPRDLFFDGAHLWVANEYADTVEKIDPETGTVVFSVDVDAGPVSMAFDGEKLWVASYEGNSIQSISLEDGVVSRSIPVSTGPSDVIWDGESLWVANRAADRVEQVNPVSRRVLQSIDVADGPTSLVFDGTNLWVANRGADAVQMINPVLGQVISTYDVGDFPQAVAWDGKNLWVANFDDDNVQLLDRAAGAVVVAIPVGENPRELALVGGNLWVASQNDKLVEQIDLDTNDVVASIQLEGRPTGLAFDGESLWVADFTNDRIVKIVDFKGTTPEFLETSIATAEPEESEENAEADEEGEKENDPVSTVIDVATGNGPIDMLWANSSLWVANLFDDTLVEINPQTLEIIQTIPVDNGPSRLYYADDSLWVTHRTAGTIHRYDPLSGELLLEIDITGGQPVDVLLRDGVLWVALENLDLVKGFAIDTGEEVASIAVDEDPVSLAAYQNSLWVINQDSDSLLKIDFESLSIVQRVPLGDGPSQIIADDLGRMWITLARGNAVQLVDGTFLDLLINESE